MNNFQLDPAFKKSIIDSISESDTFLLVAVKGDEHKIYIDSNQQSMKAVEGIAGAMMASIQSFDGKNPSYNLGFILSFVFSNAIRVWNSKMRFLTKSVITISK